jgi:hypothetical protein
MLDHSSQVQRHALSERKDDLYETPVCAVEALLRVEEITGPVWEPACGPGSVVRVLRDNGFDVRATDLVDYDFGESRIDFLFERQCWVGSIVTNPPFKLAHEFVRHALTLCPRVYTLHRLAFFESDRRSDLLDSGMLARVHVFRKRLPMMHRQGWQGRKANSGMAFAWFVWERTHYGAAQLDRISWDK